MKRLWNSMNIAFSMFSRLPAAQCDWTEENMKYMMCFFPWIGIVIGALCLGFDFLASWLGMRDALRNSLLLVIPVAVSGGIHLDGFLDTADAMSSWRPREKRLEILKDSHAGAFAIIVCCAYFVLLYGVLDSLESEMMAVYAFTFFVSRSLSGFAVVSFPKASVNGTVAGFARDAKTRIIQATMGVYLLLAAVGMIILEPVYGAAALLGAAAVFLWYYRMAMKNFGGINGDLAGCFLCVCELAMPFAMVAAGLVAPRFF